MQAWRLGFPLFLLGLLLGFWAGLTVFKAMPTASAQSNEVVRLLRSIDSRLERIQRSTDDLSRNFDRVRDWNALRVRLVNR